MSTMDPLPFFFGNDNRSHANKKSNIFSFIDDDDEDIEMGENMQEQNSEAALDSSQAKLSPSINLSNYSLDGQTSIEVEEAYFDRELILDNGDYRCASAYEPHLKARTSSGRVFHVMKKPRFRNKVREVGNSDNLLETPVSSLYRQISDIEITSALRQDMDVQVIKQGSSTTLWVDKYRPKKFADLIGNERLHREVIRWIKQWEGCVFGIRPKRKRDNDENQMIDKYGRPRRKVLFLSGPPGFGKTTLAHVAARHSGYNVIEINASDDRGGKGIVQRVSQALFSHDVSNSKPNCLIIDEIDGALGGGASDTSLIKFICDIVSRGDEPLQPTNFNKKKRQNQDILRRPIICIANDLYASALRPLRQVASVISFHMPSLSVIVNRLKNICESEGLRTESRALHSLCEMSGCDIRSCLNALQMISQKTNCFDMSMLQHTMTGRKDMQQSLFNIVKALFLLPTGKKSTEMKRQGIKAEKYVNRLHDMVNGSGDLDKVIQACFETYLNGNYHDSGFVKILSCLDWLHLYDSIQSATLNNERFELYSYLPYTPVSFYSLATAIPPKIEYPRTDYEQYMLGKIRLEMMETMRSGFNPRLWRMFGIKNISHELLHTLLEIISPDIKPINRQLIRSTEKAALSRLVKIMLGCNLKYVQERTEEGQYIYKLDPPIDGINFSNQPKKSLITSYATRLLIMQEMQRDHIVQNDQNDKPKLNPIITLTKKNEVEEEKPAVDFFGRLVLPKSNGEKIANSPPPARIWFHFVEGFANAVRKPITVRDLFS